MKDEKTTTSKKTSVKTIRKILEKKIQQALSEYRLMVGEKKFDKQVSKTARSMGTDIAKGMAKRKKKIKKN